MIIKVTTFKDGKAVVADREVPDDYFDTTEPAPSQLDIIEAQVTYTAMVTDTLLGG